MPLRTAAAEACSCIGRASDVSGFSARSNLVYKVLVLSELAQLEVTSENIAVASFESVAKFLNGVSIDKSTGCFAFSVDSTSNIAEALAHVEANGVNVAVGSAAAILDVCLSTIETILETVVDSVEAITETIGDAAELSVDILIVETFEEVGTSDCALYGSIAGAAISKQSSITEDCKPYQINKPLCYEIADSAISLYITIKSRLYLLLKEKSCTSD